MKIVNSSVMALTILLISSLFNTIVIADEHANSSITSKDSQLIGAWQLSSAQHPQSQAGIGSRLKLYTGSHWSVIQPHPESGKIIFQLGGRYSFDGQFVSETVDFAGENSSSLIGQTSKFEIKFTADGFEQIDPTGLYNETWRSAKSN